MEVEKTFIKNWYSEFQTTALYFRAGRIPFGIGRLIVFRPEGFEVSAGARFLANEAVLISHGDLKVLFDAFYSSSFGTLLLVPEPTVHALMAGEPPYDGIDALFVSHVHGDHFTAAPTLAIQDMMFSSL